jgi:uncharacterized protein (DUF305 family)
VALGFVGLVAASHPTAVQTGQPPAPVLIRPGAPGEPSRPITPAEAADTSGVRYTEADVHFMQGMIGHHAQAVEMTALVDGHTESPDIRALAARISASQRDEIAMMTAWLEARGQTVPGLHAMHMPGATLMPGMLTEAEMDALRAARGAAFDRLFLAGMIKHHQGALTMVDQLFATPGAGQEAEMFAFAADVTADQRMEIARMQALLERR